MSVPPNYRFNSKPQFSVNHISDYLAASYATQREKLIRAAKFPKKIEVASYTQVRRQLKSALCKENFDRDGLDFLLDRMEMKATTESGYSRDEALRCARAVKAFQETFNPKKFKKVELSPCQKTLNKNVAGVRLNVSLDAMITQSKDEVTNVGGIVLLYAFSSDRSSVPDRLSAASGLILWALEDGKCHLCLDCVWLQTLRATAL